MFTQCPDCKTVFELSIDDLKAAEGQVCCGECDKVFNALASLTDLPPGSQQELRAMADAAGFDAAGDQTGDRDASAGEPVSGDMFQAGDGGDADEEGDHESQWSADQGVIGTDSTRDPDRDLWEKKLAELGLGGAPAADDEGPLQASNALHDLETETSEEIGAPNDADWLLTGSAPRASWPWTVGAVIAALALAMQAVHFWREPLAPMPLFEPWLKSFYAFVGAPLPERWDVQAYGVAKDTISDHPEVAGALLVSATVSNEADRAQPYPLLKITLLDRWGEPIGERFFAPAEYLGENEAARNLMTPGSSVPASVLVMDPGAGAVSYGIDACLRDPNNRLECAHARDY